MGDTIKTVCFYPPIPIRDMDWAAFIEGHEEDGGYGWGATEAEAIADFLENCADTTPQAPPRRLGAPQ